MIHYLISGIGFVNFLFYAVIIVIIVLAVRASKKVDEAVIPASQNNKVVNVRLTGGIIGMLTQSPQNALNNRIQKENANGWRVIQVIPADSGNLFLLIFRLILLILTVFLFTTSNGYYVIMERTQTDIHIDRNEI